MSHLEGRIKEKAGPRARLFQFGDGVRRTASIEQLSRLGKPPSPQAD